MRRFIGLLFFIGLFCFPARASFTNVYIAQSSAGANNGADCADAFAVGFFNSAGNWGGGAGKIGAGTTVHLCGTFAGTAGGNMLTVQGSGSSGNPVTIIFESGATLQAPYWGFNPYSGSSGAIICSGQNYITVNGNNTGVIKNTANGTGLTYQQGSTGVSFSQCSNVTIENLTVENIYVQTSTSDSAGIGVTAGIYEDGGDNVTVTGNTVTQASVLINVGYEPSHGITAVSVTNNVLSYGCHEVSIGDGNSGASASGLTVTGNSVTVEDVWTDLASDCHGDGFIVQAFNSGSTLTNSTFANNKFYGTMCTSAPTMQTCTAYMFFTGDMSSLNIFNNLIAPITGTFESEIRLAPNSYAGATMATIKVLENTLDCGSSGPIGLKVDGTYSAYTIEGNILENCVTTDGWAYNDAGSENFAPFTSNYNVFYSDSYVAQSAVTTTQYSLTTWRSTYSQDANGTTGNPNLASYVPGSGSSAIGLVTNLCGLGITLLESDINGNNTGRPCPSGNWTAGAYSQSGSPTVATPSISPASGGYTSPQTITITTSTGGATICYTTDGSTPLAATPGTCSHGTTYSTPFSQTIVTTTTIEAIGTESGYTNSSVATNTYTLAGSSTVATPVISPATGSYGSPQTVTITVVTGGAAICYTTDGTSPAASSPGTCSHGTTYSSPFSVGFSTTVTVKALGTLATYTNSSIASATYTLSVSACTGPGQGCDTQIRYGITNPTHCDPHAIFGNTTTIPTVYYFCAQTDTWVPIPANATPGQCSGTDKPTGVDPNLNATGCSTPGGSGTVVPNPAVRRWAYIAPAGAPTSNTSQTIGDSITTFASSSQIIDPYNSPSFKAPVWQFTDSGTVSNAGIHGALQWGVGSNLMLQSKVALSVVTNIRFRFGFTTNQGASWLSSDTPTAYMADFRFSTSASDTNFQCETSDNNSAAITVIDSGVAAAANTGYLFEIKFNDSVPNVVFSINGATVCTSTTNLPAPGSTPISLESSFIPISSAPQSMYAWWFYLETDN